MCLVGGMNYVRIAYEMNLSEKRGLRRAKSVQSLLRQTESCFDSGKSVLAGFSECVGVFKGR